MTDPLPGHGKYIVRRVQLVEVNTEDWSTLDGQVEWLYDDIIQLAQDNYDWGDPADTYNIAQGPSGPWTYKERQC